MTCPRRPISSTRLLFGSEFVKPGELQCERIWIAPFGEFYGQANAELETLVVLDAGVKPRRVRGDERLKILRELGPKAKKCVLPLLGECAYEDGEA